MNREQQENIIMKLLAEKSDMKISESDILDIADEYSLSISDFSRICEEIVARGFTILENNNNTESPESFCNTSDFENINSEFLYDEIIVDNIVIDLYNKNVFIDNQKVKFSNKEFDLLVYFASNVNILLSREEIMKSAWGSYSDSNQRTVDWSIKRIRSKIEELTDKCSIETVRGKGYRFYIENVNNDNSCDEFINEVVDTNICEFTAVLQDELLEAIYEKIDAQSTKENIN